MFSLGPGQEMISYHITWGRGYSTLQIPKEHISPEGRAAAGSSRAEPAPSPSAHLEPAPSPSARPGPGPAAPGTGGRAGRRRQGRGAGRGCRTVTPGHRRPGGYPGQGAAALQGRSSVRAWDTAGLSFQFKIEVISLSRVLPTANQRSPALSAAGPPVGLEHPRKDQGRKHHRRLKAEPRATSPNTDEDWPLDKLSDISLGSGHFQIIQVF